MEFAISNTPLTCPPIRNTVGGSFGVPVSDIIPYRRNGIDIRENQPIVRLRSPTTSEANHWKGKAVVVEVENGSKADDYVYQRAYADMNTPQRKAKPVDQ